VNEFLILLFLFGAGAVGGFVDSIAGGGGLLTLPVLMGVGLPPAQALGTNKLGSCFGSASATWHYARAGLIDFRSCAWGLFWTFSAAMLGALSVQNLPTTVLRQIMPYLLIAIAIYFLLKPDLGNVEKKSTMSSAAFSIAFGLLLGFYDGFFGPGTGSFWALAYVSILGYGLTKATAHTKAMNFASNFASLLVFIFFGRVHLLYGLSMGVGQLIGARIGSKMVIKKGANMIRPIFITTVILLALKLMFDQSK
jgi:uncharacterized protein